MARSDWRIALLYLVPIFLVFAFAVSKTILVPLAGWLMGKAAIALKKLDAAGEKPPSDPSA